MLTTKQASAGIALARVLLLVFNLGHAVAQDSTGLHTREPGQTSPTPDELLATASIPRETLEKLANLTQDETFTTAGTNLWVLVPSNVSDTQTKESNFVLYKLNTNQLFDLGVGGQLEHQTDQTTEWTAHSTGNKEPRHSAAFQTAPMKREARKLGLFSNVLHKPKISPLYLINGTVCRFVNSQPICTTLSTTGLIRGTPNQGFLTPNQGFITNNQNQNQNGGGFFNNLNNNNNPPNSRQVSPPQNNFQPQGGLPQQGPAFQQNIVPNQQPFRPGALMDEDTKTVNLTAKSLSTSGAEQLKSTTDQHKTTGIKQPAPSHTIVNRRPLNLLSLARPFKTG